MLKFFFEYVAERMTLNNNILTETRNYSYVKPFLRRGVKTHLSKECFSALYSLFTIHLYDVGFVPVPEYSVILYACTCTSTYIYYTYTFHLNSAAADVRSPLTT